ncbi:hypothetical protein LCGC14_0941580, partial [marine sediment metagenome]
MSYKKITNQDKENSHCFIYGDLLGPATAALRRAPLSGNGSIRGGRRPLSDLSWWILLGLDGCLESASELAGKKATRKTWDELKDKDWQCQWLVREMIMRDSSTSGISKKDRERLYILLRKACVRHWRKKLKGLSLVKEARIAALIDRVDRVGFVSMTIGLGTKIQHLQDDIDKEENRHEEALAFGPSRLLLNNLYC